MFEREGIYYVVVIRKCNSFDVFYKFIIVRLISGDSKHISKASFGAVHTYAIGYTVFTIFNTN